MSSSNRSIARLPLHIFTELISHRDDEQYEPTDLRAAISRKLEQAGRSMVNKGGNSSAVSSETISTVGELMRLTPPSILRALDPLLTNGEKQ